MEGAHFKLHVSIRGLLPLLHEAQTERLEVDLMLGLLDDLSEQGTRCSQVIILVGQ